jgi:hypothetical protein
LTVLDPGFGATKDSKATAPGFGDTTRDGADERPSNPDHLYVVEGLSHELTIEASTLDLKSCDTVVDDVSEPECFEQG